MNYLEKIEEASGHIREKSSFQPKIALVLGSGLGSLADEMEGADKFAYEGIPHFPKITVEGHAGQLVLGKLEGKEVVAMQGRFHFYEGYTMRQITFPIRVMRALGVEILIVTNACGALNPDFYAGSLMFIEDHINFTGTNPLIGENFEELGPRFPDMSQAYDKELLSLGLLQAEELSIETFIGVHTAVTGPYYFSKAELKMIRTLGSDTIGMSTIPETIVAVHGGMRVLGISCITDMAVPDAEIEPLDHDKVMKVANQMKPKFIRLVKKIVNTIPVS